MSRCCSGLPTASAGSENSTVDVPERHELAGETRALRAALQLLPDVLGLHLVDPLVHGVEGAEVVEQLERRLLADSLDARNVVRAVPHEGEKIDHPLRLEAEALPAELGADFLLERGPLFAAG